MDFKKDIKLSGAAMLGGWGSDGGEVGNDWLGVVAVCGAMGDVSIENTTHVCFHSQCFFLCPPDMQLCKHCHRPIRYT